MDELETRCTGNGNCGVRHPNPGRWDCDGRHLGMCAVALALLGACVWMGVPSGDPALLAPLAVRHVPGPQTLVRQAILVPGETMTILLKRLGVPAQETSRWLGEAARHLNLRALPVGLLAEAVLDLEGNLIRLRLTPDWRREVVLEHQNGALLSRQQARPVERQLEVVRGVIDSSLFEAVNATGETDDLALALVDLFQWDIDFHREVQPGDTFELLCERIRADGRTVAYGPIVAATYTTRGRAYSAYRYAVEGTAPGYYDAAGRALKKLFLRAPLRLSRVTSRFSASRLHPVLGKRLPHWGVDYGAPAGTPILATADGAVTFAGRSGGRGNVVELRHGGGYITAYLHLSRFAAGVRPGARVEQGQVIGYVGSTGLSTGPHVDYRITLHGRPLNPLALGRDPAPPLPDGERARFAAWVAQVRPRLEAAGPLPAVVVTALAGSAPVPLGG